LAFRSMPFFDITLVFVLVLCAFAHPRLLISR
jgi:hypothetical protein